MLKVLVEKALEQRGTLAEVTLDPSKEWIIADIYQKHNKVAVLIGSGNPPNTDWGKVIKLIVACAVLIQDTSSKLKRVHIAKRSDGIWVDTLYDLEFLTKEANNGN